MTPDPWEEARRARDEALSMHTGNSRAEEYRRGAILMSWQRLTGEQVWPLIDTLQVELRSDTNLVDSYAAGEILKQVQSAAALVDRYRRNPRSKDIRVTRRDRERAQIFLEGQAGRTLVFRVPAVGLDSQGLDIGEHAGRASRAIADLITTLPQSAEDSRAVEGILGAPPLVREAVNRLSKAALQADDGLELSFTTNDAQMTSTLSHDSAAELTKFLSDKEFVEDIEEVDGLLDGMRGTRRVFYLIRPDKAEISGAVETDLLVEVRGLLGKHVRARLATTQWHKRLGRYGDKTYRLLSIEPVATQGSLDDEWGGINEDGNSEEP